MASKLKVGQVAPRFDAPTHDGSCVRSEDFRGRFLVLYFYPRAFTPVCTAEAKHFREHQAEITRLGGAIVGVSGDAQARQCEFADSLELSFPLIADEDGAVARAFGVLGLLGRTLRVTFLIDPEGVVAGRFHHELMAGRHVQDVMRTLRERSGA